MKVVLAHDYLNQFGGAERVLEVLCEIFPDAPIYTLFYSEEKTLGRFKNRIIKTSALNRNIVINNHRAFIPTMPYFAQKMALSESFDLIISSSAGYAKGFDFGKTPHISYCHTPLRYAWEDAEYLHTHPFFRNKPLITRAFKPVVNYLQRWDLRASKRVDAFIANSEFIKDKIKRYYGQKSEVIHPPVDQKIFFPDKSVKTRSYFLALGRFLHYKKFDLIVEAFNGLDLPIKILGSGPEFTRLRKLVKSPRIEVLNIAFDDQNLRAVYSGAKALIFPQVEDFGLVAAEALSCGTPVIAYRGGGAREIVTEEKSGVFFNHQSVEDLRAAVLRFEKMKFSPVAVRREAAKFSKDKFKKKFLSYITQLYGERLAQ